MTTRTSSTCTMCGSAVDETLLGGVCPRCLLGDVMNVPEEKAGNFDGHELLGEIARGGMGVVYRARQLKPERMVALKTLRSASLDSAEAMARFKHEAEVMVALDHAAILPVYRCGEAYGVPFFTMKLVEGGTLGERMDRFSGQWREIAELMARVCDGVRHAHERGVLHRDLKPGNILFDAAGQAYVSDFGIAKLANSQDASLTVTVSTMGTPHYLAPEIVRESAKAASVSSDVWSLGVILYELLTGQKPFRGETVTQVLRALESDEPIAPRKLRADVPRDLEVVALKALSRDPTRRYASSQAFADDLRAWLEDRPITARAVPAHERAWMWARRNPRLAGTATLLVLAVIVAAASLVWGYVRVKQEIVRVVASQVNERARLRESLFNQARASRLAHEMGWRTAGLKALREAYAIRPDDDVRDEAIAHLAGFDIEIGGHHFDGDIYPSPSMDRYAFALANGQISVRRMEDDVEIFRLPSVRIGAFLRVEFDPRGRWLAVSAEEGTRVYAMDDHRELARWPYASVYRASEDGEFLPVRERDRWVLRRTADWSVAGETRGGNLAPTGVDTYTSFHSHPQSGSPPLRIARKPRGLCVVDWRTEAEVRGIEFLSAASSFGWLGEVLVASFNNGIGQTFDLRRGSFVLLPQLSATRVLSGSTNSQFMLASGQDTGIEFWHLPTGVKLAKGRGLMVRQFGQNDRHFITEGTRTAEGTRSLEGAVVHPSCMRLLPDRQMGISSFGSAKSMALSPDGKLLAVSDQTKLAIHELSTGRLLAHQVQAGMVSLAFSPDGQGLWLAYTRGVKVFKLTRQDSKLVLNLDREVPAPAGNMVCGAMLRPDGAGIYVKLRETGAIHEWRTDSPQWRPAIGSYGVLPGGVGPPNGMITVSRDGRWISGIPSGSSAITEAGAPAKRRGIGPSGRVSFSPDSRRLILMDVRYHWDVHDAPDWQKVATSGHPTGGPGTYPSDPALEAAWSSDGSWFTAVNDVTDIHLVKSGAWRIMARLHGPIEKPVSCVIVTPDGSSLVVQRRGGAVEIWDLRKLEEEMRALGMDLRLPPATKPPPAPPGLEGPFDELELPPLNLEAAQRPK